MTCPYCGSDNVDVPVVDNGVGNEQCGPAGCEDCHAYQLSPDDARRDAAEERTGWRKAVELEVLPDDPDGFVRLMAAGFFALLDEGKAENGKEWLLRAADGREIVINARRHPGGKLLAVLLGEAREEAAALRAAAEPFAEWSVDLTNAMCHRGLCATERCVRCSKVMALREALRPAIPASQDPRA